MKRKFQKNVVQFDYFSDNFHEFERDFYHYAKVETPLTFLVDDILHSMASAQRNYFKLDFRNASDGRNHYFYFQVKKPKEPGDIRIYKYLGHSIDQKTTSYV